ncbi:hypothetical protein QJS04_geneDACA020755 [Acorus gramineus]|uniref:CRIB domain-containing protein n=1 Tax=Acorus gramineus TaxID=55184 RepID=A0AAV9A6H1_ACOGR|nr:hypothetical protein QJS04_geneDACA020755 [Acorus gramineus]
MKNSTGFLAIERLQKLIRGFKNISHLFYKVDDDDDDDDEEMEMEIGLPTDVDHVAHIGWDTPNIHSLINGWDRSIEALPYGRFELKQATDSSVSDLHELV